MKMKKKGLFIFSLSSISLISCGSTLSDEQTRNGDLADLFGDIKENTVDNKGSNKSTDEEISDKISDNETKEEAVDVEGEEVKPGEHQHSFTIKNTSDRYLAKKGTHIQKAKYYYSCECGEKGLNTFSHGYSDYLYSEVIAKKYAGNESKIEVMRRGFASAIANLDNIKEDQTIKWMRVAIFYDDRVMEITRDYPLVDRWEAFNITRLATTSGEGYPYMYVNNSYYNFNYENTIGKDAIYHTSCKSVDGYDQPNKRKADAIHYENLHNFFDPLIREDATDIEKALLIHLGLQDYWSVKSWNLLYSAVANRGGSPFTFSQIFEHLAHRYNLDSFFVCPTKSGWNNATTKLNNWNNVNIDGKWYLIDTCKDERDGTDLNNFCTDGNNHVKADFIQAAVPLSSSLNYNLIQLYKDEELAGVFHNLDTALKNINDSKSDYRLILGLGKQGIKGFKIKKDYYLNEYEAKTTSCLFNSLSIESCCDTELNLKAPSEFFNQENITLHQVKAVNSEVEQNS